MAFHILDAAELTNFGIFAYRPCSPVTAKAWIERNQPMSTIGYQETAEAFTELLGTEVSFDPERTQIRMVEGDQALVLRLTCRRGPGAPPDSPWGERWEWIKENSEMGLLTRIG